MAENDVRATVNRLLLVNALTEGAIEAMMENHEYFDDNDEFLGDLNCTDALGNTALHLAVQHAHPDDVVALCAGPVDVDICNNHGDRPLYVALKKIDDAAKRFDIVKELLSCGAEYKQAMPGGLTPFDYAQFRFPSERDLLEIIANPPRLYEEELQPEQRRRQMYDSSDFAVDDEAEGKGSNSESE